MNNNLKNIEVIGLGQACIDYLGRVPHYPLEDEKIELMELFMQCGGPASTALVTLSRFGISTSFIGIISDDPFGLEILKHLKDNNIDTTYLKRVPEYTSQFAFIAIAKKTGNRNIFWRRGSAPFLRPTEIDLRSFQNAKFLHLDDLMVDAGIEAAKQAKDMGLKVVLDAGTMRDNIDDLTPLVDHLITSRDFARPLIGLDATYKDALKALKKLCPGDIVITLGSEGSIGYFDNEILFQKAFSIKPVDTTGAGDVYHGAYIYGLIQGWDMPQCMRFASATAALKCRKIGAQNGIPNLDEVFEFMDSELNNKL